MKAADWAWWLEDMEQQRLESCEAARADERRRILGVVLRHIGEARLAHADEAVIYELETLATEIEQVAREWLPHPND